jgi:hypothetical protein
MSLKTDFLDGANGFTQQMADVFAQGEAFITTNLATITTQLQENAGKGLKKFKISLTGPFEPANLRLKGLHMETYFSGIRAALLAEDIYMYEVQISLNTNDTIDTKIDLDFTF